MASIIDNLKVGNKIKELLKKNNMTQSDLALKLNITKSAVSQNLNGKSSFDLQNLILIAEMFNLKLEELLDLDTDGKINSLSQYEQLIELGLDSLKKELPNNLNLYVPDLYGKVFIDYVIKRDEIEFAQFLFENKVKIVDDLYHRAKDIYLDTIYYMLIKNLPQILPLIYKYTELKGSFKIDDYKKEKVIWEQLNKESNIEIVKELLINKNNLISKVGRYIKKTTIPITNKDLVEIIGKYHLKEILIAFSNNLLETNQTIVLDDLVNKFIKYNFIDGISIFINIYFKDRNPKKFDNVRFKYKKIINDIINIKNEKLIFDAINYGIYDDLTEVVNRLVSNNLNNIALKTIEPNIENLNLKKIGRNIIGLNNEPLLKSLLKYLKEDDKNYLLNQITESSIDLGILLIKNGARVNEKYYNSRTFNLINEILEKMMKEDK